MRVGDSTFGWTSASRLGTRRRTQRVRSAFRHRRHGHRGRPTSSRRFRGITNADACGHESPVPFNYLFRGIDAGGPS